VEGAEEKQMRLRVLVTMMAEVDVEMQEHSDGGGAAIRPTLEDGNLIISYAAYDLPENTPPAAKAPLYTVCAHLMTGMALQRLDRRLNRRSEDEPSGPMGPTQGPANC